MISLYSVVTSQPQPSTSALHSALHQNDPQHVDPVVIVQQPGSQGPLSSSSSSSFSSGAKLGDCIAAQQEKEQNGNPQYCCFCIKVEYVSAPHDPNKIVVSEKEKEEEELWGEGTALDSDYCECHCVSCHCLPSKDSRRDMGKCCYSLASRSACCEKTLSCLSCCVSYLRSCKICNQPRFPKSEKGIDYNQALGVFSGLAEDSDDPLVADLDSLKAQRKKKEDEEMGEHDQVDKKGGRLCKPHHGQRFYYHHSFFHPSSAEKNRSLLKELPFFAVE